MITVRFWAAAREASGVAEEQVEAISCAGLVETLSLRDPKLAKVLAMSSFLVDGRRCSAGDDTLLTADAVVEVLPPFAGG